jgi:ABC-2 type transport system permease protein
VLPGVTAGLLTGGLTLAVAALVIPVPLPAPGVLLFFSLAAGLLFAMLGTVVGLWAVKWDQLSTADTFLMLPLAFLSGAFFTLDGLPEIGRALIALNPVFYAIDGARFGALGTATAPVATGAAVVIGLNLVLGLLVWRLFATGYRLKP